MSLTKLSLDGLVNRSAMNLLGAGELFTTGNVYYVDSNNGSDGNLGTDPAFPKASIDNAVSSCTANNGDIIVAMPNHTETVTAAGGLDLDVAGLTVIGLGSGSNRPQINLTTATTADIDIDAADITMVNILITGGKDAIVAALDVNSNDFTLVGSEIRDVTGQMTAAISVGGDRCTIQDFKFAGATAAGANACIELVDTADRFKLTEFEIDGNFASAVFESLGTATNVLIRDGYIRNRNSADLVLGVQSTGNDTGNIGPRLYIRLADDAANVTEIFDGPTASANMNFFDPIYVVNADSERGLQYDGAATTDA